MTSPLVTILYQTQRMEHSFTKIGITTSSLATNAITLVWSALQELTLIHHQATQSLQTIVSALRKDLETKVWEAATLASSVLIIRTFVLLHLTTLITATWNPAPINPLCPALLMPTSRQIPNIRHLPMPLRRIFFIRNPPAIRRLTATRPKFSNRELGDIRRVPPSPPSWIPGTSCLVSHLQLWPRLRPYLPRLLQLWRERQRKKSRTSLAAVRSCEIISMSSSRLPPHLWKPSSLQT